MSPRIAVIGGSLVGPAVALMLKRAGLDDVTVYEARPPSVSPSGGVIGLDVLSLDALDQLGLAQEEYIPNTSERVVRITVRDLHEDNRVQTVYPGRNTTWTMLHAALMRRAEAFAEPFYVGGARLTGLSASGDGARLDFDGHDSVHADIVVFADGRTSVGRRLLDPERTPSYAGYVAVRGLLDRDDQVETDWFAFSARKGPLATQMGMTSIPGYGLDWTMYMDLPREDFAAQFGAEPENRWMVTPRHFGEGARARVVEVARELLPASEVGIIEETSSLSAIAMANIAPPTQSVWSIGDARAILIGDALAPVRPHTAAGANNGLHQASELTAALGQHARRGSDLDGCLTLFQDRQLPQVAATLRKGQEMAAALGLGQ